MLCIKQDILAYSKYSFIAGKSVSNEIEHIKERETNFRAFKEEVVGKIMICSNIQTSISLWREDLETVI